LDGRFADRPAAGDRSLCGPRLRRAKSAAGRTIAIGAILLLAAAATTPIGLLIIAPLEDRFLEPTADMPAPDGIIVLGGAINDLLSRARGQTVLDEGDRVVQAAILAKRYPKPRVVFSGGSGSLTARFSAEALEARRLLSELGVDPARISSRTRRATPTRTLVLRRGWFIPSRRNAGCSCPRRITCRDPWACSKRRGST
jgi:uncharacterized SAM-binding protein YcdF (DUF218 family)